MRVGVAELAILCLVNACASERSPGSIDAGPASGSRTFMAKTSAATAADPDPTSPSIVFRQVADQGRLHDGGRFYTVTEGSWCGDVIAPRAGPDYECLPFPRRRVEVLVDGHGNAYSLADCTAGEGTLPQQVTSATDSFNVEIHLRVSLGARDKISLGHLASWLPCLSFAGRGHAAGLLRIAVEQAQRIRPDPLPTELLRVLSSYDRGSAAWVAAERCRNILCEPDARVVEQYVIGRPAIRASVRRTSQPLVLPPSALEWKQTAEEINMPRDLEWLVQAAEVLLLARLTREGPSAASALALCGASYCGSSGQVPCSQQPECQPGLIPLLGRCTAASSRAYLKAVAATYATIGWQQQQQQPRRHQVAFSPGPIAPRSCRTGNVVLESAIGLDDETVLAALEPDTQYAARVCVIGDGGAMSAGDVLRFKTLPGVDTAPCAVNDWDCLRGLQERWTAECRAGGGGSADSCRRLVGCRRARISARWALQSMRERCPDDAGPGACRDAVPEGIRARAAEDIDGPCPDLAVLADDLPPDLTRPHDREPPMGSSDASPGGR